MFQILRHLQYMNMLKQKMLDSYFLLRFVKLNDTVTLSQTEVEIPLSSSICLLLSFALLMVILNSRQYISMAT